MAERNNTREVITPIISKKMRSLTVQLQSRAKVLVPCIRLHGRWLVEAGFSPNTRIHVRIMEDCLVITKE